MSLLPPINNNKQTQNVVRSSTFGKQDKLPEINKTNRLEAIFKKLDLRDDEVVSGTNDVNKTLKISIRLWAPYPVGNCITVNIFGQRKIWFCYNIAGILRKST